MLTTYTVAAFFSFISLNGTPSFWPLVLLLCILQLYIRNHERDPFVRCLTIWPVIALAGAFANLSTAIHALSTPIISLIALSSMSLVESGLTLLLLLVSEVWLCNRLQTPWPKIILFPTLWATLWTVIAHINPVGRLLMWSPVQGFGCYEWLSRIAGPFAIDWAVAVCATVFSHGICIWLVEPKEGTLIELDDERPSTYHPSESRHILIMLASIMATLTLPSFIIDNAPLPPFSVDTTPLTVGCVLPSIYDKHHASTLEDFIVASAQMTGAKILVWPESAVAFNSQEERDAAFEEVRQRVRGPAVGISFEEFIPSDSVGQTRMRRNGFALLAPNNSKGPAVMLSYYKRHLVPIAESFSLVPSRDPPEIVTLDLRHPTTVTKPDWAPAPNYTRPIPLTASICLDFSSPAALSALVSRPALILAPARTWHPGIGLAMWKQAKARAEEMGSMILWCDGGEGGVSGVAGGGMTDFMQFGGGSWLRTIGVQWPFDETRTVYARWGDWYTLIVLLMPLGGGWAEELVQNMLVGRAASAVGTVHQIMVVFRKWTAARLDAYNGETQQLLD